jgi:hypothetical protein
MKPVLKKDRALKYLGKSSPRSHQDGCLVKSPAKRNPGLSREFGRMGAVVGCRSASVMRELCAVGITNLFF